MLSLNYTGIGSMPFKGENAPKRAIDCIFENFKDIPYWVQLPHFHPKEDMVLQFTQNLAGFTSENDKYFMDVESEDFFLKLEELYFDYETLKNTEEKDILKFEEILDKYAITKPYSNTIDLFLEKLKEVKPHYAKGSVTGPFTFATSINDKNSKSIFYDETTRDIAVKTLALKALWQIKEFKKASPDTTAIIFMDEPSVSQIGSCAFLTVKNEDVINSLNEVSSMIKKFKGLSGVHCCGKTDWTISINADVNIINFDAFSFLESVLTFSDKVKSFMEKGGYLALGIVPTLDKESLKNLDEEKMFELANKAFEYLKSKGIEENLIKSNILITPSCGCGSLSDEEAIKAICLTKNLSGTLRGLR